MREAFLLAVERIGGQAALAAICKVTPQAVNQWARRGRPPADQVLVIEAASGVSRYELRPDVFGTKQAA